MSEWTCKRCGFSSTRKDGLKQHLLRTRMCDLILEDIMTIDLYNEIFSPQEKPYKCEECNKSFSHLSGKSRHKKTCETIKNQQIVEQLLAEIEELKASKARSITNNNNNTTNNTINNNITNNDNRVTNITINAFGNENYDYIDFKELMNDNITLMNLIEQIHFNQDHPENWNVCINNMRSKYAEIYDGSKCILQDKRLTIDKLIKDKCEIMIENKELIENEKMSKSMEQNFKEVVEYITSKQHHEKNKDYNEMFGNSVQKNNKYSTAYNKTEVSLYNNKDCLKKVKDLQ